MSHNACEWFKVKLKVVKLIKNEHAKTIQSNNKSQEYIIFQIWLNN